MNPAQFDDIRPYKDEEISAAMQRITDSEFFPTLATYVYPNKDIAEVRTLMRSLRTISEFQLEVMRCVSEQIIARSISEFSYAGLEHLDTTKNYLFVSNHRDIMLDSCLVMYALTQKGFDTAEITFGSNLMSGQLIIDIGKSNKMFRVERGKSVKELYMISQHLSEYIRYVITEKRQSVWIAQRNGRTKDGNDTTDQGIVKMFCMSMPHDKIKALSQLNMVPIAVSYEWEPCDILKTLELYEFRHEKYIKKPGEDLNSILTGIVQNKGKMHIEFCKPITENDLLRFADNTNNEYHKNVAALIDERIRAGYRLSANNYIAHDIRYGELRYAAHYTEEQKQEFIAHLDELNSYSEWDLDTLCDIFLGIYSNPVRNKGEL
ncbi:MAG: acyltransferase [Bacteroidales bacterium]|jgi:hypothetical protein|nr:acyltransferase [Bacteroidales bacterium]